ncbi:hypothetical protein SAMN05421820_101794 [Pedobacter steynii]|uniref:Nuclear transport factor 2 family protein n=1 Tax=Pedobacter steynii TaxID=430522 RepID=A0A1G9L7W3_9SPHI|nr:hypothetical protein [Pedobacter steynii]NQX38761.1 hypothetical protein [Pedobacter steynii]SDL57665.1 hypothetical protein SAMN05421820_101794 [Pedobacter steynii]
MRFFLSFTLVIFIFSTSTTIAQTTKQIVQDAPVYAEMLKILTTDQECPKYFSVDQRTLDYPHIFGFGKAGISDYLENPEWSFIRSTGNTEDKSVSKRYLSKRVFKVDPGLSFTVKAGFKIFSPVAYSDDKNRCFAVYEEFNDQRRLLNLGAMFFQLKDNKWILLKNYVPAIID